MLLATAAAAIAVPLIRHLLKRRLKMSTTTNSAGVPPSTTSSVKLTNPHLKGLQCDNLFHLFIGPKSIQDLKSDYNDVKFVCVGGSANRIANFSKRMATDFGLSEPVNLCETGRFCMYKVGPVLAANHGMGNPSTSILLNELLKMLKWAACSDLCVIRMGTSGGVGVEPGTLVLTETALDGCLHPYYTQKILGKEIRTDSNLDSSLNQELLQCGKANNISVVLGKTISVDGFYEDQCRLNGAFCNITEDEKMEFLQKANAEHGVKNFEMESLVIASLCARAGVRAAVVCVTLLNRLVGDDVKLTGEQLHKFEQLPTDLVRMYIHEKNSTSLPA